MTELKTLIDVYDKSKQSYISDEADETVEGLKNAAKEWIKELEHYYLGGYTFGDKWYSSDDGIDLAVGWIKHFFNLEE